MNYPVTITPCSPPWYVTVGTPRSPPWCVTMSACTCSMHYLASRRGGLHELNCVHVRTPETGIDWKNFHKL